MTWKKKLSVAASLAVLGALALASGADGYYSFVFFIRPLDGYF